LTSQQDVTAGGAGTPVGVILAGAGRMGQLLRALVEEDPGFELVGTYDIDTAQELDEKAPAAGLVIDFSNPGMLPHVAAYVRRTHAAYLTGTTNYGADDLRVLDELGEVAPVIWSANFSLGVATLRRLAREAAATLAGFDCEIVECHHRQKVDAPSGTAKLLLEAVGATDVVYGREGVTGVRPEGEVAVHALRGGTVAGTHEVLFLGPDEEVILAHRAASRQIFASGAMAAARRLLTRPPARYTFDELMFDE